jgi:hypothetical protein
MRSTVSQRQYAMSDEHDQGAAFSPRLHRAFAGLGFLNFIEIFHQDFVGLASAY